MSWVAEPNATTSAQSAISVRSARGSRLAMATSPAPMTSWASSIQLRRLPRCRVSGPSPRRSTTGAQKTLMEYVTPTQLKKPMVLRLTS